MESAAVVVSGLVNLGSIFYIFTLLDKRLSRLEDLIMSNGKATK